MRSRAIASAFPRGQQANYLSALADAGALPSNFSTYMMDAASKTGPFTNSQQQKDIMKGAKMNLLSAMIRGMDGVEDALVVFDIGAEEGPQAGNHQYGVSHRQAQGRPTAR